jgi:hypothetical protein
MSDIAKLYSDVMAGVEAEKTAAASDMNDENGIDFDRDFFEKVASGDEDATAVINEFIEEARSEGASDEDIESAIAEAMETAGIDENGDAVEPEVEDEYEQSKAAAYLEGSDQAVTDVLDSDFAKEAGVTADDLLDYELGGIYGAGYAETREIVDEVVTKIAEHKKEAKKGKGVKKGAQALAKKLMGKAKAAGTAVKGAPGAAHGALSKKYLPKNVMRLGGAKQQKAVERAGRMATGTMAAGGAAGLGAAGYGASRMAKKDKK